MLRSASLWTRQRCARRLVLAVPTPLGIRHRGASTTAGSSASSWSLRRSRRKESDSAPPVLTRPGKELLVELARLARPHAGLLAVGSVGLLASSLATMYVPTGFGAIIDIATGARVDTTLMEYSAGLAGVLALGSVASFVRVLCFQLASQRQIRDVRKRLFGSILEQEMAFFDQNRSGELVNRLSSDVVVMANALTGTQLSLGLRSLAQALFGLYFMVSLSPQLTLAILGVVPVAAGTAFMYGRFVKTISARVQDALAAAQGMAEERIGNVRTVRAFVQEARERARYGRAVDAVYELAAREARASALFFASAGLTGGMSLLAVLLVGGRLVSTGVITTGSMTSFLMYTFTVASNITSLSSWYSELMRALGASNQVLDLMQRRPADKAPSATPAREGGSELGGESAAAVTASGEPGGVRRCEVRFEGVNFRFPSRPDAVVFDDLSLDIPAGQVTAVVGPSGSGKSTLVSLLLRFYEPQGGRVLMDGVPVRDLDPSWVRHHIGYVPQDPVLFSSSVRDNIRYARPDATDEEVEQAARAANAHDFVSAFPQGYDTPIGERGTQLSGGQRQRLAIARALLKGPDVRVLVLDEPTSALDAESEALVTDALERLKGGRTVLVIAHRLSTVAKADRIVVLANGRVAEVGKHSDLLARPDGVYRRLMQSQLDGGLLLG